MNDYVPAEGITARCDVNAGFTDWVSRSAGSIAATMFQACRLAFLGWDGRQISLLLRPFSKPMGFAIEDSRCALATQHEVTLLNNAPVLVRDFLPHSPGKYDGLYLPRATFHTGDLNVHDLAYGQDGLWLVNTRFSCLARVSYDYCFESRWRPPFISELAPEDRCHLNGLGLVDTEPKFVTAFGVSNEADGWRANKSAGGVLLDVPSGDVLLDRLSMPHSPRWHQGALWFLNSGTGELCRYSKGQSEHDVVITLPGFLRGLCLVGDHALVGLSKIREQHIFGGLPVQERFSRLICGIAIVDLRRGTEIGRFEFLEGCTELYDVQFVRGLRRPTIVNLVQEAARQAFPTRESSYWLRKENLSESGPSFDNPQESQAARIDSLPLGPSWALAGASIPL